MQFNNKLYNVLKFVALVVLPALGTFYATLADTWGWPNTEAVVQTVLATDTLLGILLGLSTRSYNNSPAAFDGTFVVVEENGSKKISLDLENNPEALGTQKVLLFKNEVMDQVE